MRIFYLIYGLFVLIACNNNAKKKENTADIKKEDTTKIIYDDPTHILPDTIFTGFGTEPFWAVYIINSNKIVFHPADGPDVEVSWINAATPPDAIPSQINASGKGNNIHMMIEKKDCSVGMSEETYPYSVTVSVNREKYTGCGKEPEQ